jgi:hypothetical protein
METPHAMRDAREFVDQRQLSTDPRRGTRPRAIYLKTKVDQTFKTTIGQQ